VRTGPGLNPVDDGATLENSRVVTLLSEYRRLRAAGELQPIDVPVLIVGLNGSARSDAAEYRTSTRQGDLTLGPVVRALLDQDVTLAPLVKSDRNPYENFIFVGRASTCDVILRDASVSKSHAVFERDARGGFCLRDNRSHNGTWIEGERLAAKARVTVPSGSAIVFGAYPAYLLMPDDLGRILAMMPDLHA
jgi:hypothetical protein